MENLVAPQYYNFTQEVENMLIILKKLLLSG